MASVLKSRESIVRLADGFRFGTSTAVVVNSQLRAIASGVSLTVAYAFSDGAARQP